MHISLLHALTQAQEAVETLSPATPAFKGYITPTRRRAAWEIGRDLSNHDRIALRYAGHKLEVLMDIIADTVFPKTKDIGFCLQVNTTKNGVRIAFDFPTSEPTKPLVDATTPSIHESFYDLFIRLQTILAKVNDDKEWIVYMTRQTHTHPSYTIQAKTALDALSVGQAFARPLHQWEGLTTLISKGSVVRERITAPLTPMPEPTERYSSMNGILTDLQHACADAEKALRNSYYDTDDFPDLITVTAALRLDDSLHKLASPQISGVDLDTVEAPLNEEALCAVMDAQYQLGLFLLTLSDCPGIQSTPTQLSATLVFMECDTEVVLEGEMGRKCFHGQGHLIRHFVSDWKKKTHQLEALAPPTNLFSLGHGLGRDTCLVSGADANSARHAYALLMDKKPNEKLPIYRLPKLLEIIG